MIGEIKIYIPERKFGFIKCDDKEIFFHKKYLVDNYEPQNNDFVEFDVGESNRGSYAYNVRLCKKVSQK